VKGLIVVSFISVISVFCLFRLGASGKSLIIETKLVVEMKTNNMIAPYEFKRVNYFVAVCCSAVIVVATVKCLL